MSVDVDTATLIKRWRCSRESLYPSVIVGDELAGRLAAAEAQVTKLQAANHNLMRINGGLRGREEGVEDDHWCAVEGCQNEPTMYEFDSDEFVCDEHVYYGAENPLRAPLAAAEAQRATLIEAHKKIRVVASSPDRDVLSALTRCSLIARAALAAVAIHAQSKETR